MLKSETDTWEIKPDPEPKPKYCPECRTYTTIGRCRICGDVWAWCLCGWLDLECECTWSVTSEY